MLNYLRVYDDQLYENFAKHLDQVISASSELTLESNL